MHWMPDPISQPRYAFVLGARTRPSQRVGLVLAIVLHLALFALLVRPIHREITALLEMGRLTDHGGGGGGGGGDRMAYISLPAPSASPPASAPEAPVVPAPVVATPAPPPIEFPPTAIVTPETAVAGSVTGTADSSTGAGPGTGGGTGGGAGGGNGPGTGPGSGPGTGGGAGGLARGPRARAEMFPSLGETPKEWRGRPIRVVMTVGVDGKVNNVRFEPDVTGKFGDRMRETFKNYRFRPALSADGTPIESSFVYTINP